MLNWSIVPYISAAALILGAAGGWKVRDWQCDAAYAKALEQAQKKQQAIQENFNEVSALYEAERNKADGVATVRTNTIREIYRTAPAISPSCAAPDSVVGLLQGAVASANGAAAGEPVNGM